LAEAVGGRAQWKPVADFSDEVTDFALVGDSLYLLAAKGHPRGRVLLTSASKPDIATARELVPESGIVLEEMVRARDGLYLRGMDGGLGRLERLDTAPRTPRVHAVPLPYDGTLRQVDGDPGQPGVLVQITGWLQPPAVLAFDATGHASDTGLTPRSSIDTRPYTSERRFATAKDGTRIPYDLVYRKGLKRDGTAPAFISAYGSYGAAAYTPAFNPRTLALMDQGAIVGYAAVRGGGEYGREWHRAGQLENKPNTWRDLIAVSEDMIAQGYTAPAHLAIGGRSAGGITMGRALTERPDLFAAVVSGVGWHDPLRYVVEQDGYGEEPEWGAISDPAGYRALKAIDSYQAVVDGTKYPAVLLTTGLSDPRVAPFHVAKMAARLQAATTSGKPVLMRVDFDAGHGIGSTRAQADAEAADTYAFILWQTAGGGAGQ
jgi:prolyl oligopeptidase